MKGWVLFWTAVAAVGQVAGAFATALAVIVSLWVVLSGRAVRIKASAGLRMLIAGDREPAEDVIAFEITNVGERTVRVSTVGWRSGWMRRFGPKWARYKYAIQTGSRLRDSRDPPYVLEPGEQKTMLVDLSPFQGEAASKRNRELFGRQIPVFGFREANIRFSASVVGARASYFKVEPPLARFLLTGNADDGAEKFNAALVEKETLAGEHAAGKR